MIMILIVFFSGCINTKTDNKYGVIIESFEPEFNPVYSGEPVTFYVRVRNTGDVEAEHVHIELLGLDEDWCTVTPGCDKDNNQKKPNEPECQRGGDGFSLRPASSVYGTPGESHVCTWDYVAPTTKKFSVTYPLTARVFYTYKTITSQVITFASREELKKIGSSGESLPSHTLSTTHGPVELIISTESPVRFWEGQVEFPLRITVINTGGGTACASDQDIQGTCKKTSGKTSMNRVRIVIKGDDNLQPIEDCEEFKSGKAISLWEGKSATFICKMRATNLQKSGVVERSVVVTANYEYYMDGETSITVNPKD